MNGTLVGSRLSSRLPTAFADAMSELASGVVVVTCRVAGRPWGMTVTAFASVSIEPPTVLVSLASESTAAEAIAGSGQFGVSVLPAAHVALARYASKPGEAKYLEPFAAHDTARSATPAVDGALAHLDCEVVEAASVFDHTVFFARVLAARSSGDGGPLVYHRRHYRTLADHKGDRHAHR